MESDGKNLKSRNAIDECVVNSVNQQKLFSNFSLILIFLAFPSHYKTTLKKSIVKS